MPSLLSLCEQIVTDSSSLLGGKFRTFALCMLVLQYTFIIIINFVTITIFPFKIIIIISTIFFLKKIKLQYSNSTIFE